MSSSSSPGPPPKRARLEDERSPSVQLVPNPRELEEDIPDDLDEDHCCICLQKVVDRTVIPVCSHEFCFDCLMIWSEQSRRCPLCSQNIGDHVIHSIRSRYDYQKHFLPPLRSSSPPPLPPANRPPPPRHSRPRRIPREVRERIRREREEKEEADRFERALEKRRWIYKHDLYAKHVASNAYTRFRPYPTPAQFAASPDLISRTTSFLRRELQVWMDLDVEFLTTFIISLMKAIDIRSESAVKLLAEFLDMDAPYVEGGRHVNAEHFAHEIYSYVRSPYKDLFVYDTVIQYECPPDLSPPRFPRHNRGRRWRESPHSRSRSYSRSSTRSPPRERRGRRESRSRTSKAASLSWSPSGRQYPATEARERELTEHTASGSRRDGTRRSGRSHQPITPISPQHDSPGLRATSPVHEQFLDQSPGDRIGGTPVASAYTTNSASATGKGKEKATNRFSNEVTTQVADREEQGTSHVTERPTSSSSAVHPKKPPRYRSIIQSVQAHLSSERRAPAGVDMSSSLQSPPSLLSRLSDTYLGVGVGVEEASAASSPYIDTPSDARVIDRRSANSRGTSVPRPAYLDSSPKDISPLTVSSGRHDTSISSKPNVGDLVHVRAAGTENRDRNPRATEISVTVSPESEPERRASGCSERLQADSDSGPRSSSSDSKCSQQQSDLLGASQRSSRSCPRTSVAREESHVDSAVSTDDNGTNSNTNSGPLPKADTSDTSTLRSRLSKKLEEERRKAQVSHISVTSGSLSSSLTSDVPPAVSGSHSQSLDHDMSSTISMDSTAVEARLRVRALLKARLATEKRNVAGRLHHIDGGG